jgi:hypothetical protein
MVSFYLFILLSVILSGSLVFVSEVPFHGAWPGHAVMHKARVMRESDKSHIICKKAKDRKIKMTNKIEFLHLLGESE